MTFNELNIIQPILKALTEVGYSTPTEIQTQAIPAILNGSDVLGCAQTGTGKTAAFAIPILQKLHTTPNSKSKNTVQTLILTPTRELAIQIEENFKLYGKELPFKTLCVFGGVHQNRQIEALRKGVHIIIATPGRLIDLVQQGFVDLSQINTLVLDEADHMLDIGFIHDIKRILAKLPQSGRQTLLFSATMRPDIKKFAQTILVQPTMISVSPKMTTAQTVQQFVYHVDKKDKPSLLKKLIQDNNLKQTLVFTRTKHGANKLVKTLNKSGITAEAIHGDKSQNTRQRTLENFKANLTTVMVATDIAARGIDIDELPHVINYDLPQVAETYVHRIGRTGRAGHEGVAISFCDLEQKKEFKEIQNLIGFDINVRTIPSTVNI